MAPPWFVQGGLDDGQRDRRLPGEAGQNVPGHRRTDGEGEAGASLACEPLSGACFQVQQNFVTVLAVVIIRLFLFVF